MFFLSGLGRVCVVILAGYALCMPLHAEWRELSSTAENQFWYDDAIEREGDQVSVWRITDFSTPLTNLEGKEVRSEKTRTTIDCAQKKIADSQVTRYAQAHATGEVMNHYETPLRFTRIAPGSVDAWLAPSACR